METRDMGKIFGIKEAEGKTIEIMGMFDHPYTPERKKEFIFFRPFLRDFAAFMDYETSPANGFFYYGPTGTGKSDGIRNFAAVTGTPLYEINANVDTSMADIFGENTLVNGNVIWKDGPMVKAARDGGIFAIHEISYARANVIGALNTILDRADRFIIPNLESEVIKIHKNFKFVVTDNTNGTGDYTGRFIGVKPLNLAFMDRFMLAKSEYLPKVVEVELLKQYAPGLSSDTAAAMVDFANKTREMFNGTENTPPSISGLITTRTLIMWGILSVKFRAAQNSIKYSLERAFLNKLPPDEVDGVESVAKTFFSLWN
jgi:cobaltochelatase CobS